VMDKLERLVETLKLVATSSPLKIDAKSRTHNPENGDDGENDGENDGDLSLEETMQNYDIDADSLMQKFSQILSYETLKYEFYWNAESIFVDHMCREYSWLLGAEGYALVTLQQTLRALCPPPAAGSESAAQARDRARGKEAHHSHHATATSAVGSVSASLYSSSWDSRDEDDARSLYSSRDDEDKRSDALGLSIHNNEILISSSSKMKGIAMSLPATVTVPVLGSE
jgi:hypothetical protein